jgi:hypothetical protein
MNENFLKIFLLWNFREEELPRGADGCQDRAGGIPNVEVNTTTLAEVSNFRLRFQISRTFHKT